MKRWQVAHLEEYSYAINSEYSLSVSEYIRRHMVLTTSPDEAYQRACLQLRIDARTPPFRPMMEFLEALNCEFPTIISTHDDDGAPVFAIKEEDGTWAIERKENL